MSIIPKKMYLIEIDGYICSITSYYSGSDADSVIYIPINDIKITVDYKDTKKLYLTGLNNNIIYAILDSENLDPLSTNYSNDMTIYGKNLVLLINI